MRVRACVCVCVCVCVCGVLAREPREGTGSGVRVPSACHAPLEGWHLASEVLSCPCDVWETMKHALTMSRRLQGFGTDRKTVWDIIKGSWQESAELEVIRSQTHSGTNKKH